MEPGSSVRMKMNNPMKRTYEVGFPGSGSQPVDENLVLSLLEYSPDVICVIDKEGRFLQVSAAAKQLWGYDPAGLSGSCLQDLVVAKDLPRIQHALKRAAEGHPFKDLFNPVRCADGSHQPTIWSGRWHSEQEVAYCIARDGSFRQEVEDKAFHIQQQLYRAYKLAQIGWWEWQAEEGQFQVSDELLAIYGLTREQGPAFSMQLYLSLVHPGDAESVREDIRRLFQEQTYQYDHRMIKPSGEEIHVIHYIKTERDKDGQVVKCHGTTKDITARKTVENALRQSQQRLEDIVESLGDGFYALDHDWRIAYWNHKAERVTRLRREDVVGKRLWDLYPKATALKFFTEFTRAVAQKVPVHFEEYSPTLDCWMEVSAYPSGEGLSVYIKDINARKRSEEERRLLGEQLKKAQDNLQTVLESMSDGFYTVERNWNITFATDRVAAMLGVNKEAYIGKNHWECFPLSVHRKFYTEYHRAFAQNTLVTFEEYLPSFSLWVEVSAYPHGDTLSIYVKDITARRKQEQELQISNERFEFVSMATSDVIWDWNVAAGELYINQSFSKVFGHDLTEGMDSNRLWADNLHPEDKDRVIASRLETLHRHKVLLWEENYRFVKKNGETAYVSDRAVIIRSEDGTALRMVGAIKDITEQKRQEKRLEFMAKATSEVIWERGVDSEEVEISGEKLKLLFGYEASGNRMPRTFWWDKIHPDDRKIAMENKQYALEHGLDFYLNEYRFQKADGSWAYVKDRSYLIRNDEGAAVSLLGAMEDITRERLSEKALLESEKTYRQFFDNAPFPKMIIDTATLQILDVNSTAVEHYGYSRDEFTGLTLLELCLQKDRSKVADILSRLNKAGRTKSGVIVHVQKGGSRILVEVSITQVDFKGQACYLASVVDVTEKIKLQEALLQEKINFQKGVTKAAIEAQEAERSEIGRELHDNVNQILASAKLYVENVLYYPDQSPFFIQRGISLVQESINEIRRLSRALVTPTIRDVGFCDTIQDLADSYRDLQLFELVCSFRVEEKALNKDIRLTIYRILQEALNNTVKYAKASLVQISIEQKGQVICLNYKDNGIGYDPHTIKRGIGLANIRNRADAYQGDVKIFSSPGQGCRIQVSFPLDSC